jgi:hypothetical protein
MALAEVPTKVLIFSFCFSALKNNSIYQRSLYYGRECRRSQLQAIV